MGSKLTIGLVYTFQVLVIYKIVHIVQIFPILHHIRFSIFFMPYSTFWSFIKLMRYKFEIRLSAIVKAIFALYEQKKKNSS